MSGQLSVESCQNKSNPAPQGSCYPSLGGHSPPVYHMSPQCLEENKHKRNTDIGACGSKQDDILIYGTQPTAKILARHNRGPYPEKYISVVTQADSY